MGNLFCKPNGNILRDPHHANKIMYVHACDTQSSSRELFTPLSIRKFYNDCVTSAFKHGVEIPVSMLGNNASIWGGENFQLKRGDTVEWNVWEIWMIDRPDFKWINEQPPVITVYNVRFNTQNPLEGISEYHAFTVINGRVYTLLVSSDPDSYDECTDSIEDITIALEDSETPPREPHKTSLRICEEFVSHFGDFCFNFNQKVREIRIEQHWDLH